MGRKISLTISDIDYSGMTASAKEQVEMLQIAAQSSLLPALSEGGSDMGLVAIMAALDGMQLTRLKNLCIGGGNIVRTSDGVPVAENLFQDRVHYWLLLLGRVLQENIGPFWQLSEQSENGADAANRETAAL